jgi:hypothetical protein
VEKETSQGLEKGNRGITEGNRPSFSAKDSGRGKLRAFPRRKKLEETGGAERISVGSFAKTCASGDPAF